MALEQELKAIEEDFEEAYYSRKEDLESLNDIDRKIMKMHWGGIVIECFVKYLTVEKYSMNKMRKSGKRKIAQLFSSYTENILREKEQAGCQLTKDDYDNYAFKLSEGHDFIALIENKLKFKIPVEIDYDLNIVYDPLEYEEENKCFIDLRYESEDLSEIEVKYEQWKKSYKKVMIWLHSLNIEKEDYKKDIVGGE